MAFTLQPPHRLARINYPIRVASFGFAFAVVVAVLAERELSAPVLFTAALSFLVYPHLAILHARLAFDSKRAEMNNLVVDAALLGVWIAQLHYPIWPALGALLAVNLNNAICGGVQRLVLGLLTFLSAAVLWGAVWGLPWRPDAGMLVAVLCFSGIAAYASALGLVFRRGNKRLVEAREVLAQSERQFQFIAENSGNLLAIVDRDWRIRYRSSPHVEHFNPNRVEPGASWLGLVHPDERERAAEFLAFAMQAESRDHIRLRMLSAAGTPLPMQCDVSYLGSEFGGDARMLLITCRPAAETPGDANQVLRGGVDALVVSDASGRTQFADAGYERLTGHAIAHLVGRTGAELRSAVGSEELQDQVARALARDGFWEGRCLERRSDGSLFLAWVRVVPVTDGPDSAPHLAWLISDLSQPARAREDAATVAA